MWNSSSSKTVYAAVEPATDIAGAIDVCPLTPVTTFVTRVMAPFWSPNA